jgi:ABC-type uncharacterized transport system substrate-binding protein
MFVRAHKRVARRLPAARTCAASCVLAGLWLFFAPVTPALAHPHVWVTIRSELVYAPDGSITAIRHSWAFDDMFSTYALQGIEHKNKGAFTREELASLADTNVTSLKEYDYFNYARIDGKKRKDVFGDPTDYWLDYKDSVLTLHFTLPLKTPVRVQSFEVDVYDPEFFIDFAFADDEAPVTMTNAPAQCALTTVRPNDVPAAAVSQRLNKSFQAAPTEAFAGMGSRFANKILVKCS